MKTHNFAIDLMVPNQINKDIIFNESLLKIDQFLNNSITCFVPEAPNNMPVGSKFIISEGENKNHICYRSHESKEPAFLKPIDNMVVFCVESKSFFAFVSNEWTEISISSQNRSEESSGAESETKDGSEEKKEQDDKNQSKAGESDTNYSTPSGTYSGGGHGYTSSSFTPKEFTPMSRKFTLPSNLTHHHLYLAGNCMLQIENNMRPSEITLVIKQNEQSRKNMKWPGNIIWENQEIHVVTNIKGAVDIIKLYSIAGSDKLLGKVIFKACQL